jgi:hypothetical protein
MIRRRAFLKHFFTNNNKYIIVQSKVIFLNLYYVNKIPLFSKNVRLFLKRFKHRYLYFFKNKVLTMWSKTYYSTKKKIKEKIYSLYIGLVGSKFYGPGILKNNLIYIYNGLIPTNFGNFKNVLLSYLNLAYKLNNKYFSASVNKFRLVSMKFSYTLLVNVCLFIYFKTISSFYKLSVLLLLKLFCI